MSCYAKYKTRNRKTGKRIAKIKLINVLLLLLNDKEEKRVRWLLS